MKKLLLSTAAIAGLAMIANPAAAQVKLELGGYFKGYGAYVDQEENADTNGALAGIQGAGNVNDLDFIRDTEIHFGGETTLDNGLSVGAHIEAGVDGTTGVGGNDSFQVDESYVYFSGGWGRVNFGDEDGAAYLLQVAAPSADSNIDGIRQYVQPVNYTAMIGDSNASGAVGDELIGAVIGGLGTAGGNSIDYDQDPTGKSTKLTYLSPIMNGFQAGLSYSPDTDGADDLEGIGFDDVTDTFGASYEAALRYEGQFNNVGVILGAGYSHVELEQSDFTGLTGVVPVGSVLAVAGDPSDDRQVWNVGADLDFGAFGLGVIYREDNAGEVVNVASTATAAANTGDEEETWVVGADYTTGPFKLGASYLTQDNTFGIQNLDTERYSGGVTYTYGPGMTFRGSIGYVEHEATGIGGPTSNDIDATYVTLGTQINF